MNIKIIMKSISQTRNLQSIDYSIRDDVNTLKELISNLVNIEIDKYEQEELKIASQEDLDQMIINGKVSFGFKYRETDIDRANAVSVALQAFEDGLYVVFLNNSELKSLTDKLILNENDSLSLVRLTMLTGRYY